MSPERRSHYVHGSSAAEQSRLEMMNRILDRRCLAELSLAGVERILDVGCGQARFSIELARAAPISNVIAVERDEEQLRNAKAGVTAGAHDGGLDRRVEVRRGDALELPLAEHEWGSFDLVWARFLLEHVHEPERVVRALVRAARPGGRIVLCDDDHELLRLDPPLPAFEALWSAYRAIYRDHGNDPEIGRRLPRLLVGAGARLARNTWIFFGSCAGARDWELVIDNCRGILSLAREEIERHLEASAVDLALDEFERWSRRPDASFWLPLAWAEGVRPATS